MAIIAQAKGGDRQTIVIVGGGIGGLTAALALSRVGFRAVVAERSDRLSEVGAGIQLSPNAGRVLADLGLDARIAAAAIEPSAIEIRSAGDGKSLTTISGAAFTSRYGFPYRVLHRADLQTVLANAVAADPNVTLHLAATVSQYLPQAEGLLVRIAKAGGSEVVPAIAVVAADGVWSTFREKIARSARPAPTGRTAWRALVPADVVRNLVPMDRVVLWLGPNAHLVHYPVAHAAAVNIVATVREDWQRPGWSAPGDPSEVARRFADWPIRARDLIAAPVAWQKYAIVEVPPEPIWADGRFVLLGDAAHAMAPFLAQGACMAIEDAAVLAATLKGTRDVPTALSDYAIARKTRVGKVAAEARRAGNVYHWSGPLAFARDAALRLAGEKLILERSDWIYSWTISGE